MIFKQYSFFLHGFAVMFAFILKTYKPKTSKQNKQPSSGTSFAKNSGKVMDIMKVKLRRADCCFDEHIDILSTDGIQARPRLFFTRLPRYLA